MPTPPDPGTRAFDPNATADQPADPAPTGTLDPDATGGYAAPPAAPAGELLAGRYALGDPLGEGGMGCVYRAEQVYPVRRPVAVKLIRPGTDTARVVARFEAERQALALMDHPHIARVFDAGTTDRGQPFFVMELVAGEPVTAYCDRRRLPVRDRLELFALICQAVQHAHQKGVMHRDLKPGNILVAEVDGRPVPKVIDFGLAKALGPGAAADLLADDGGGLAGTPLYMAPEQADPDCPDIDTRADVYALGVILYELLVGSTPVTRETVRKAVAAEVLRQVREAATPPPADRLRAAADLPNVAAVRGTDPAALARLVRGELEWIALKCLEKDRGRRYETASGLAADVRRFLAHEPVAAGPASGWYRARKFVRRHRGPVLAAGLLLAALVAGVVGTALGLVEARRQRDEADAARRDEAAQRAVAEEQRAAAERGRAQARQALDAATDDAVLNLLGGRDQLSAAERQFLERAAGRYQAFAADLGTPEAAAAKAGGDFRIGLIRHRLGLLAEAETALLAARAALLGLADPAALADTHYELGQVYGETGRRAAAEAEYRAALAVRRRLAADHPADPAHRLAVARTHGSLAIEAVYTGRPADAEREYRSALALFEALARDHPQTPGHRSGLARTLTNLGLLADDAGRAAEAEGLFRQALAVRAAVAADRPDADARMDLADSHHLLATHLRAAGRLPEAEAGHKQAEAIRREVARANPAVVRYQSQWASSLNNLGVVYRVTGRPAEAEAAYRGAADIYGPLAAAHPTTASYAVYLAGTQINLGGVAREAGRPADGLALARRGADLLAGVLAREPTHPTARQFLRNARQEEAMALNDLGRHAEAATAWRAAVELAGPADRPALEQQLADALARAAREPAPPPRRP